MTFTCEPAGAASVPAGIIANPFARATVEEALKLQRPLPNDHLKIVAKGERKDEAA